MSNQFLAARALKHVTAARLGLIRSGEMAPANREERRATLYSRRPVTLVHIARRGLEVIK